MPSVDALGINKPPIYVLFYAHLPPNKVHETLEVQRDPPSSKRYRFQTPPDLHLEELDVLQDGHDPE